MIWENYSTIVSSAEAAPAGFGREFTRFGLTPKIPSGYPTIVMIRGAVCMVREQFAVRAQKADATLARV